MNRPPLIEDWLNSLVKCSLRFAEQCAAWVIPDWLLVGVLVRPFDQHENDDRCKLTRIRTETVCLRMSSSHAEAEPRNADEFVRNRVDLVIEFQIDQHVAPVIADKIDTAGIPGLVPLEISSRASGMQSCPTMATCFSRFNSRTACTAPSALVSVAAAIKIPQSFG
jgi:hypothetical protein